MRDLGVCMDPCLIRRKIKQAVESFDSAACFMIYQFGFSCRNQMARSTLPERRQRVQTLTCFVSPFTIARTRWIFGFHLRFVFRCEWLTFMPDISPFAQISQTLAMGTPPLRRRKLCAINNKGILSQSARKRKLFFHLAIRPGIVGAVLCLSVVEAIGAAADGEDRGGLDARGAGATGEEIPPSLKGGDDGRGRVEVFLHETFFTANLLFQCSFDVPIEDVFGSRFFPTLDEGTEEIVMIGIEQGVALSFIDILCVGQLCARHDVDRR